MVKKIFKGKRNIIGLALYLLLAFVIIFYTIILINHKDAPLVSENGIINFADWKNIDFEPINLTGEWEFYWQKLLVKEDFKNAIAPDAIVKAPAVWNSYKINGKNISGFGYATYRMRIENIEVGKPLSMRVPPCATSYKMYIDDELVAQNGTVGNTKETSKGEYKIQVCNFTPQSKNVDIIIQTSNYTHANGGLWYVPQIGTPKDISEINESISNRDIFLLGCFTVMLCYSISIYTLERKEKNYLFFAILCLATIGRTVVCGSYFIAKVPVISQLNILIRLEYLSSQWFGLSFLLLSSLQFPNIIPTKIKKIYFIYSIFLTGFICLTPVCIFTKFNTAMSIICIAMGAYTIAKFLIPVVNGIKNTWIIVLPGTFVLMCGLHDVLINKNVALGSAIEYLPIGFFLFLLCENIVIAKSYAENKKENERALILIESISQKERDAELKFLKSQIKPHFIYNALNSIIAVSRRDPEQARNLLFDFSQYLHSCFDFENLDNLVPLDREVQLIHSYISIEQTRFQDVFKVEYDIENVNIQVPYLILEPLVENAIRHGIRTKLEGGKILIYIKKMNDKICLGVKDNGIGIEFSRIEGLLEGSEIGHGYGIYNINQRLARIYNTSLIIENNSDGGANIYMMLPVEIGGNNVENSYN